MQAPVSAVRSPVSAGPCETYLLVRQGNTLEPRPPSVHHPRAGWHQRPFTDFWPAIWCVAEANETTLDVTPAKAAKPERHLTPMECHRFGLPLGSVWSNTTSSEPIKPFDFNGPSFPQAAQADVTPAQEASRFLTPHECKLFGVPPGSRYVPKSSAAKKAVDKSEKAVVRQEVEVSSLSSPLLPTILCDRSEESTRLNSSH